MRLGSIVAAAILSASSLSASAYDGDTHFYGTYSLARFSGIKHEVALKLATGAQWMDESYISDPVSLIILPDVGVKKRRLLHFPGSRVANKLTIDKLPTYLDPTAGVELKSFTETEAEHPFASEMITEGFIEGDLMKVGAGLHTLEDSFAHAGTIAELGHAHFWHHPDRPFIDEQSVEKYFKMTKSVLKAMVATRALLPFNAIDTSFQAEGSTEPNYKLTAEKLAELYAQNPLVRTAIMHKTLNDPKYVKFALKYVFKKANEASYLKSSAENIAEQAREGLDTYEAAGEAMPQLLSANLINVENVIKDSDLPTQLTADYVLSMGGLQELVGKLILNFISDKVPRPLSVYHRFEKEEDGPLWTKEMEIRVTNMRGLIKRLFNKNIFFVENNTKDAAGFQKEFARMASAKPVLPAKPADQPDLEYVTYSLDEKTKFNNMIFGFMFPKLSKQAGKDLEKVREILMASNLNGSDTSAFGKIKEYWRLALSRFTAENSLVTLINLARQDIFDARIKPHEKNKFFTIPDLVEREKKSGGFKTLISDQELSQLLSGAKTE